MVSARSQRVCRGRSPRGLGRARVRVRGCVLGVAHLRCGGSSAAVVAVAAGGSGESWGAGKRTLAFWAWVWGPGGTRPAARPEAAWARAGSAAGLPPPAGTAPARGGLGRGVTGRDPPRAGAEPRSPAGGVYPCLPSPANFCPCMFQNLLFSEVYAQVHVITVTKSPLNGDFDPCRVFTHRAWFLFSL